MMKLDNVSRLLEGSANITFVHRLTGPAEVDRCSIYDKLESCLEHYASIL